ncbi:multifunctional CCA addition/repair protein [Thiolapillus brandeum]|uniref:tRNA nucleotidyltransferase n=1 Tax=Thiolapillus brandeum TaxID=1076588 RepID=A0A7U6JI14_9GAMM|nr:multifunctional CCA addition/repair protein [Thiolapillus brandeum]BAO45054.1 tRNA nucleotidyltransferase [Thiolapillus brandeum]
MTTKTPLNPPEQGLQTYLVGGCVRDQLLGRDHRDRDWVVIGSTEEEMLARGFKPVGRDFPVFLHPLTREEYALARGIGPDGELHTHPGTTLEEDLARRDLTVNAMAMDPAGRLIDPFHGQQDLEQRMLRHMPCFRDDPLRLLRLARLAAQLDFRIAPETCHLAADMAARHLLDKVAPERQWQELHRALSTPSPRHFIEALRECSILHAFLPEIDDLFGVPQPERYHPEIDTGEHVLLALDKVVDLSDDPGVCFAVLLHDLGKAVTPREYWPSHRGHEALGVPLVDRVCQRLRIPSRYHQLARKVARYHLLVHLAFDLKPATLEKLLSDVDAWRNPEDFERFLLAAQADAQGRKGLQEQPYPQADYLRQVFVETQDISAKNVAPGITGRKMGEAIRRLRCEQIGRIKKQQAHRKN